MQQFEVTGVREETIVKHTQADDARAVVRDFESRHHGFRAKSVVNLATGEELTVCDRCEACGKILFEEQAYSDEEDSPDRIESDSDGNTLCGKCYSDALSETLNGMNIRDTDGKKVVF